MDARNEINERPEAACKNPEATNERPEAANEKQHAACEEQERRKLLEAFILAFLPAVPSRHRNLANEVHHVATTLSRVMLQHFGFRVGLEEVLQTFAGLRYTIFSRNGTWDPKKKQLQVISQPDLFGMAAGESHESATTAEANTAKRRTRTTDYLHVNVNPHVVRTLRLTTIPLPPNTNEQKRQAVEQLYRRIDELRRPQQPE